MTKKQAEQFNRMRNALIKISREYMKSERMHNVEEVRKGFFDYGEYLTMAYDNIQEEARFAVRGVKEIKDQTNDRKPTKRTTGADHISGPEDQGSDSQTLQTL